MNKIARIALNNLVLKSENKELENEVNELNKYVEDFKERLDESEYNNRALKNKIWELEDSLELEKSRHFFYATKFKQLLMQDKYTKYRAY